MTSDAATRQDPWVADATTFGARLALIRQRMGWGNVKVAAEQCGLPVESWRHWERDGAEPRRIVTIAVAISTRTGCDLDWLVYGPQKPVITHSGPGRQLSVEYPFRRDLLAARIVKSVVANGEPVHGDGRRRRPEGGPRGSDNRPIRLDRKVSPANHAARILRGSVA